LAEACLITVNRMLSGDELTIIALGKFGGEEISYGADLDVLFVADDDRQAQKLLSAMAQPSAEGTLPRVDVRLRPEGEKGPLVGSIDAYRRYYAGRAQLWELQALTRARPIIGPRQEEFMTLARKVWCEAGQHRELFAKIDDMLERIRRERGTGSDFLDFKTGSGGMIEAEFLVQALQMRSGSWEPNWQRALALLEQRQLISKTDATAMANAYDLLRHCELVLRRFDNKSVSSLPGDSAEQAKLAKRVGYKELDTFATEYRKARDTLHALYVRYIKPNDQSC
jgi:glutamate-ammonia-ligase adenylyltransferase